jgi:bifunctional DNA-binding transcriptional regulator/antitoxin component of YhaV-PrlF toxin-antitoxin module
MASTTPPEETTSTAGFGTVDDKGRITLSRAVRGALGIKPGSSLAYVVLDGMLLLVPQDEHLAELIEQGSQVLANAGLTVRDLLDELPPARAEVVAEAYGADFLHELERLHAAPRSDSEPAS